MEFYYHEIDDDVLVLRADGGLNAENADEFLEKVEALVEAGLRKIIVDCSGLTYVSSSGLGTLIRLHRNMAQIGGNVKVAAISGPVAQVLELTRLTRLFEIYPDVDRARLAFRPKDAV